MINLGENELKIEEKVTASNRDESPLGKAGKFDHIIMVVACQHRVFNEIMDDYREKFVNKKAATSLR